MRLKIAMIILAAGFSQRMGVLKPLLPVGETSALSRAVSLGRHEKIHMISVVTGHRHEEVEAALLDCHAKNVRHVHNARYADGMLTSVKAGIRSLPTDVDGFFLLPVDVCAVRPETLEKLMTAFILSEGEHIVYPTTQGRRGHPPLIPYALAAGLRDYDGDNGMQGYLSGFSFEEVELEDPGILMDMDTPDDYAVLLRFLGCPTYADEYASYRLLDKYGTPEPVIRHSHQVGEVALNIADMLTRQGVSVNKPLLYSACLLHDMARSAPDHEDAGAKLVLSEGYPDTAYLVRHHMDLPDGFDINVNRKDACELMILYLADKLCRDGKITPPAETLKLLEARFASDPDALESARKRIQRAQAILSFFETEYGVNFNSILS
jgi:CTP:molybdopterin cytidylyltransferase MocA